jgi:hypothetical protein
LGTSIKDVLQSILNTESAFCTQLADLENQIASIWNTINGGPTVKNVNITSCNPTFDISLVETPTQKTFKLGAFVPKKTILPYFGNISDFFSSGLGRPDKGLQGWAIANGNNGTVNVCGRYLKYDCEGCCTTGGSNTITLQDANIPIIPFSVDADFTLSGTTNEAGQHNHNILATLDTSQDFDCEPRPVTLGDSCDNSEMEWVGPNGLITPPDLNVPINNTSNSISTIGPHSHTFDATATGSFSSSIGNPVPTPLTIEPEYIAGIPIQFIGCP